jgi:hypothetical protein
MFRRMILGLGLSLVLSAAATAATENFFGSLDGIQENPDVVTSATGFGTAMYDSMANTLAVSLSFSGLSAPTNNAHIHCCATSPGANAGVAIDFPSVGFPIGVTSGTFSHVFDLGLTSTYNNTYRTNSGGTADGARDRLLNSFRGLTGGNLGVAYFNIHTAINPGGEIRGNILTVPEPTTLGMLMFAAAGWSLRRRRAAETFTTSR